MMHVCVTLLIGVLGLGEDPTIANLRSPDEGVRLAAVAELRDRPGDEVSRALTGALRDRSGPVKEAVLRALGKRGDVVSVKALRQSLRALEKDPDLLPVVIGAIGEARDVASAGSVVRIARKSLGRDPAVADAAILSLGELRAAASVAGLVELLVTAEPVRGGAASRAGHARYVSGIRRSLQRVTGLPFRESATWQAWWRGARRDWQPTPIDPGDVESDLRRDDAWRFSVERPDRTRWSFEKVRGAALRMLYTGPREEATFAWIDVIARSSREGSPRTVEEVAREQAEALRQELGDAKEMKLGGVGRLAGVSGVVHEAVGRGSRGRPVRRRVHVMTRGEILYVISVHVETGASERVTSEIEGILASFRWLDG